MVPKREICQNDLSSIKILDRGGQIRAWTFCRASFNASGFDPPPWAMSERPPPVPPMIGAISFKRFPAWYFEVRSLETRIIRVTLSPFAVPKTAMPEPSF